MPQELCISCRLPKASVQCEICKEAVCTKCEHFMEADQFSFLPEVPEVLSHTHYCPFCYTEHVEKELESYNEIMERAKNLYFFFNTQRKPVPVTKRAKEKILVENCPDRDETILRMAFLAACGGFSAIIEAEVTSKKVRNEGWQKMAWQGIGIPCYVDIERLEKSDRDRERF